MFKLSAHVEDNDFLVISTYHHGNIVGEYKLELRFREDGVPCFTESGFPFDSEAFEEFIKEIEKGNTSFYSFDDMECFNGFMFISNELGSNLQLKMDAKFGTICTVIDTKYGETNVVQDLRDILVTIGTLIQTQREYYDSISIDKN